MIKDILTYAGITNGWIVAGVVLAWFVLAAIVVFAAWASVLRPLANRISAVWAGLVLPPLRRILVLGIILAGISQAYEAVPLPEKFQYTEGLLDTALQVIWIAAVTWQIVLFSNSIFGWYFRTRAARARELADLGYKVTLLRKIATFAVIIVGLLLALAAADVNISPLLAGGAIGGIVIGLALQDTLSNLFAGFYIALDRPVRVGDYIKLENGEEGHVEEIGWRNTKVRMLTNNLVVVPNSSLAQSTITNYYLPYRESTVNVTCGVAYDTDLQHAEDVAVEVGREVQGRVPRAQTEWAPVVRWQEFGESSINFLVILRVTDHDQKWLLQSEYIKALHRRFGEEGIEIPFPVRTVVLKEANDASEDRRTQPDAGSGA